MLVEFERRESRDDGEDEIEVPLKISINPNLVEAVFEDQSHEDAVIIRLSGRGMSVRGTYAEVLSKLAPYVT